ncbi:hypothetical protein EON65_04760 [archaeon]|nr:MAG: hypothetical protein EON65_04760 [archaeon]
MEEEDDAVIEIREYLDVENDSKVVKTELVDISQELELIKKFTKMHEAKTNNNIEQKQNSFGECEGDLRAIVSKATDVSALALRICTHNTF